MYAMGSAVILLVLMACLFFVAVAVVAVFLIVRNNKKKNGGGGGGAPVGPLDVAAAVKAAEAHLTTSPNDYLGVHSRGSSWEPNAKGVDWWTSGFMPGCWWKMYYLTNTAKWKDLAQKATQKLSKWKGRKDTHDVGFVLMSSYGNAPENERDTAILVSGAKNLAARYDSKRGLIKSWEKDTFTVIIDNMMNLRLLWEAAKLSASDKESFTKIAVQHAQTSARVFVRADGSTYHKLEFKNANSTPTFKGTHQGLSDESTWSRGQAWAVCGFTEAAQYSGNADLRAVAEKCAKYFIDNLPSDNVPLWDFKATDGIKDTSAAAIAACGLFKLSKLTGNTMYADKAKAIVASLSTNFLGSSKGYKSLLCCATASNNAERKFGVNEGYVVADYYYLDALLLAKQS